VPQLHAEPQGASAPEVSLSPNPRETNPVDIAILEVGLGGRLDATNIVDPLLSIITDIALDHQDYLGDTIAAITREKAGILRPNGTLITLPQHPEANQAIGEAAATLNLTAISAAPFIPPTTPAARATNAHAISTGAQTTEPTKAHVISTGAQTTEPAKAHVISTGAQTTELTKAHVISTGAQRSGETPVFSSEAAQTPGTAEAPKAHSIPAWGAAPGTNPHQAEGLKARSILSPNRYTLTLDNQPLEVDSPLQGQHQQRNIALAIAAAIALRNRKGNNPGQTGNQTGYNIPNAAIEAGIRNTRWPGRLELIPGTPPLLLDVAHNPAGAWTLRAAIAELPPTQPRTLIFSCLRDKSLKEMAQILLPLFDSTSGEPERAGDHILLAPIDNPRAASIDDLLAAARALDVPAHAAPHLAAALAEARALTPPDGLIIATGSVYLVGEIRNLALNGGQAQG
jgi:dihydrofolate synthase/folylpolyglutamate synthase